MASLPCFPPYIFVALGILDHLHHEHVLKSCFFYDGCKLEVGALTWFVSIWTWLVSVMADERTHLVPVGVSEELEVDRERWRRAHGEADSEDDPEWSLEKMLEYVSKRTAWFHQVLFVLCVSAWLSDGMQPILASFLLLQLRDGWKLDEQQGAMIGSALFLGMLLGSTVWGIYADRKGRKATLYITVTIHTICSLCMSFTNSIGSLLFWQALVGFGVGGNLPVVYSYYVEFSAKEGRGFHLAMLASAWSVGEVFAAGISWMFMSSLGWRYVVRFTVIPGLLTYVLLPYLPETPHFLLVSGKKEEAFAVVKKMAAFNGLSLPLSLEGLKPLPAEVTREKGSVKELLSSPLMRQLTLLLWVMWFLGSVGLYGVIIFLPSYFQSKGISLFGGVYGAVFFSTLGNIPGIIAAAWILEQEWCGRKGAIAAFAIMCAFCTILMSGVSGSVSLLITVTLAKFFVYGMWAAMDAYTPEAYPTTLRSTGNASASAMSRLAGLLTPPVDVSLIKVDFNLALIVWAISFAVVGMCAWNLPIETQGNDLKDRVKDEEVEDENMQFFERHSSAYSGPGSY